MNTLKNTILLLALIFTTSLYAQILDTLRYEVDGEKFMGFVAKPSKITSETKTILIVHEWWGLNDYPKSRALKLAKEGFIAVCIDMYGEGIVADNPKDASELAGQIYENPKLLWLRFNAGYETALKIRGVNPTKIAAIGYCFGGSVVLNAAKMGAPLDAVVSFHGGLVGVPLEKGKMKAAVLVCNGAADQFVSEKEILNFKEEMNINKADFTFINYDNATHAFTNPNSTKVGEKFKMPIAYNKEADDKSWTDFMVFMRQKVK